MRFQQQLDLLRGDNLPTWEPPTEFPDPKQITEICIDLETYDPELKTKGPGWATGSGFIVGIAISTPGFNGYFPIRHERGGNFDENMVKNWLKDVFKNNPDVICHNASYDIGWLRQWGVECNCKIYDTMIAAPLIDENRFSYALNSLGKDFLGERKYETGLDQFGKEFGFNPKEHMDWVPVEYAAPYAEKDTDLTLKLWNILKVEIQKQNLNDIFQLETDLLPILIEMKWKGVRVDMERADQVKKYFKKEEKKIYYNIMKETNIDFSDRDIWTATAIQKVFDKIGEEYELTEKSKQPKFDKAFLNTHSNPIVNSIVRAREFNKAHTTFVDTFIKHEVNGRIHAEIHQMRGDDGGTVSGRMSMSNPNLQQIPARDQLIGPMIRSIFIPEEKTKWGTFDYSQQEPRLLVHYAKHRELEGSDTLIKFFEDAGTDFHQVTADMAGISRKEAKTIGLGLMYGMGLAKLGNSLDITVDQAKELKKTYNNGVPFLKDIINLATRHTEQQGYIRTLLGRKCRFDLWESREFEDKTVLSYENALKKWPVNQIKRAHTYRALNRLIQGSAADQTKKAMVKLWEAFRVIPMIQIHDELDISVEDETQIQGIKDVMESAVELHVPSKCDVELGKNWGEIK